MCRAAGAGANPGKDRGSPDFRINVIDTRDPDMYRRITYYNSGSVGRKVRS
jgi:hypothetical protein